MRKVKSTNAKKRRGRKKIPTKEVGPPNHRQWLVRVEKKRRGIQKKNPGRSTPLRKFVTSRRQK